MSPLSGEQIVQIHNSGASLRLKFDILSSYYNGTQSIAALNNVRMDGQPKSKVLTNWVEYITNFHVGFSTATDINYTLNDSSQDKTALNNFTKFYELNRLNTQDSEHFSHSLLYGKSIEVYSYNQEEKQLSVSSTDPTNWVFVFDEFGALKYGVYKILLPRYSVFQGKLLEATTFLYYLYDSENISSYTYLEGKLRKISEQQHIFGIPPISIFHVKKEMDTFFSDGFLTQSDTYDIVRSSLVDDIQYSVDSFLMLKGMKIDDLLKKDDDDVTVIQKIKEMRFFPLPEGAEASFLSKNTDVAKFEFDLSITRQSIHLMGSVPDLTDTVKGIGASTRISGTALQMLFQSTIQRAAEFTQYFELGLRSRVDFFNRISHAVGEPEFVDYDIKISHQIPRNEVEIYQYLANLKTIVSKKDLLRQISWIDNPTQTLEELEKESKLNSEE